MKFIKNILGGIKEFLSSNSSLIKKDYNLEVSKDYRSLSLDELDSLLKAGTINHCQWVLAQPDRYPDFKDWLDAKSRTPDDESSRRYIHEKVLEDIEIEENGNFSDYFEWIPIGEKKAVLKAKRDINILRDIEYYPPQWNDLYVERNIDIYNKTIKNEFHGNLYFKSDFGGDWEHNIEFPSNKGVVKWILEDIDFDKQIKLFGDVTIGKNELILEFDYDEELYEYYYNNNIELQNEYQRLKNECDKLRQKIESKKKEIAEKEEREEVRRKLLTKQRKKELEKEVLDELIQEGLMFPDAEKRPHIPREVADAVWRRDKGRCAYCGSDKELQLDHIIPFSKGGATTFENLQILCKSCNLKKSNNIG